MYTDLSYQINTIPASVPLQSIRAYQLWGDSPRQKGGLGA